MERSKKIGIMLSLLFTMSLLLSLPAFAQMKVDAVTPAATATPVDSQNFVLDAPLPYDGVELSWNFSKGMDKKFDQNILNISVQEKGLGVETFFDDTAGVAGTTATGGDTVSNADFIYTKEGEDIRELALKPTTVSFEAGKTYVVTIYDTLSSNTFEANNGTVLAATYTFEFTTNMLTATPGNRKVTLKWTTDDERDIKGFNILRAAQPEGPFEQVNDELIKGTGDESGKDYTYTDKRLRNRRLYYYQLEVVDWADAGSTFGEAEETPLLRYFWKELIDFLKGRG